jgi:MATE family multidrug resistance protein
MASSLTDKRYLGVALPFMFSTMTQPLMGAVNTAVMGRLSDPIYISGVALGAVLFNTIYWLFGFLRVGTSGYAAQALGSGRADDKWTSFGRPLLLSLVVSALLLLFQGQILEAFLNFVSPEKSVADLTRRYYRILIWGAPLVLFNYVSLGWLMGQARIRAAVFMQVSSNVLNIILSIVLTLGLELEVAGVAAAALASQLYGAVVGLWLMRRFGGFRLKECSLKILIALKPALEMLTTNGNLILRTMGLMVVNNVFSAYSASFGTSVLAANSVLLQVTGLMAFMMDGLANGNSLFVGRAVGQGDQGLFEETRRMSLKWAPGLVILLIVPFWLSKRAVLGLFSANPGVVALAESFSAYAAFFPVFAIMSLTFYGLYTGSTCTAPIRDMMLAAMTGFVILCRFLAPPRGNDGLWLAYLLFYGLQSVCLLLFLPRLRRKTGFMKSSGSPPDSP